MTAKLTKIQSSETPWVRRPIAKVIAGPWRGARGVVIAQSLIGVTIRTGHVGAHPHQVIGVTWDQIKLID